MPDRRKYVNVEEKFLRSYIQLVVEICHKRGAHATAGMTANLVPMDARNSELYDKVVKNVCQAKLQEIQMGLDGFMIWVSLHQLTRSGANTLATNLIK